MKQSKTAGGDAAEQELYEVVYDSSATYFRCLRCKESFRFRDQARSHAGSCEMMTAGSGGGLSTGRGAGAGSLMEPMRIRRDGGRSGGSPLDERLHLDPFDDFFDLEDDLALDFGAGAGGSTSSSFSSNFSSSFRSARSERGVGGNGGRSSSSSSSSSTVKATSSSSKFSEFNSTVISHSSKRTEENGKEEPDRLFGGGVNDAERVLSELKTMKSEYSATIQKSGHVKKMKAVQIEYERYFRENSHVILREYPAAPRLWDAILGGYDDTQVDPWPVDGPFRPGVELYILAWAEQVGKNVKCGFCTIVPSGDQETHLYYRTFIVFLSLIFFCWCVNFINLY